MSRNVSFQYPEIFDDQLLIGELLFTETPTRQNKHLKLSELYSENITRFSFP